jgi:hypothetical protein
MHAATQATIAGNRVFSLYVQLLNFVLQPYPAPLAVWPLWVDGRGDRGWHSTWRWTRVCPVVVLERMDLLKPRDHIRVLDFVWHDNGGGGGCLIYHSQSDAQVNPVLTNTVMEIILATGPTIAFSR